MQNGHLKDKVTFRSKSEWGLDVSVEMKKLVLRWLRIGFEGMSRGLCVDSVDPILYNTLSKPSSAEVKKAWSYTSTPPIRLHGVVLS
jgi:hypothetical protein